MTDAGPSSSPLADRVAASRKVSRCCRGGLNRAASSISLILAAEYVMHPMLSVFA